MQENIDFRLQVLVTEWDDKCKKVINYWVPRRPIPDTELWFEDVCANYKKGNIYNQDSLFT